VAYKNRAFAGTGLYRSPDRSKYVVERLLFLHGLAKRVIGVNAVEGQGLGVEIGPLEGPDVAADRLCAFQRPLPVHPQDDCGDLQQCVGLGRESACFNIDDHRQVAAKALADRGVVRFVFHARQDTQCEAR